MNRTLIVFCLCLMVASSSCSILDRRTVTTDLKSSHAKNLQKLANLALDELDSDVIDPENIGSIRDEMLYALQQIGDKASEKIIASQEPKTQAAVAYFLLFSIDKAKYSLTYKTLYYAPSAVFNTEVIAKTTGGRMMSLTDMKSNLPVPRSYRQN